MFYYIYQNEFIMSDELLPSEDYSLGVDYNDYLNGMYVPLNQELINYEKEHPSASPDEVWHMHPISEVIHVKTYEDQMFDYFLNNHNLIYINDLKCHCWMHLHIIYDAECCKIGGRLEFIFEADGKVYKGSPDYVISMMRQIGLYYYDLGIATGIHYRYIKDHPEEKGTYDYTVNLPEIPHFTLEELHDFN